MTSTDLAFYKGKRVLVTGHTGFKGTWLTRILTNAGAEVLGCSRCGEKEPDFFKLSGNENRITHVKGDVRDYACLLKVFEEFQPEIVLHLAALAIVREGYKEPRLTYETNVMGTVHVMDCVRQMQVKGCAPRSVLNVTSDKVYMNCEKRDGYREEGVLDGYDPYSNSKSCSELVTHSYHNSFFRGRGVAVSTARAGNVIGGGDFAKDRIIPDCLRAIEKGEKIGVRNPGSVRPYQHVLEALFGYLTIAAGQYRQPSLAGCYNVGPAACDAVTTETLVNLFCKSWGEGAAWENRADPNAPHEDGFLKLDCGKMKRTFGWSQRWHIEKAIEEVCNFDKVYLAGGDVSAEMDREIAEFLGDL